MMLSARMRTAIGDRALLAAKVAVAAGAAWLLAPLMPGTADEYPYYAPLGAVISMHPTFAQSFRVGFETLLGLLLGVLLAGAFVLLAIPPLPGIMLVTGIGVLLGGLPRVGAGRDYLPVAALFVLVLGGGDADGYSFGYMTQMALGVTVGLAVNLLVFPPLRTATAKLDLEQFRERVARDLESMATDVVETWPPDTEHWTHRAQTLLDDARRVRASLDLGHESSVGNPRARIKGVDQADDYVTMNALDSVVFQIHDLSELLAGPTVGEGMGGELPDHFRGLVAECLKEASALTEADGDRTSDTPQQPSKPLAALQDWLASRDDDDGDPRLEGSVSKCLHRIQDALLTV